MSYFISELFIYPVKSLGGFSVKQAETTDRGFKYDRRWMLVDNEYKFLSQREIKEMSLLQTKLGEESLIVFNKNNSSQKIEIALEPEDGEINKAVIWEDEVGVLVYGDEINDWFCRQLNIKCKLVFMPEGTERKVDTDFAKQSELTSLSDGYPFLIIGQESLNLLNSKLETPLPMNRFRPNIVFTGGKPHDEDNWKEFKINDIKFRAVKPCARCVVTTVNQDTGEQGVEPLKTLSTYRRTENNKVLFGMNLLHQGKGIVKAGDELLII